jgi:hypothetical protein
MNIKEVKRPGWTRPCPNCHGEIRYTVLKLWNGPEPFFYSDKCNDVLLRKSDAQRVPVGDTSNPQHLATLLALWELIVKDAPPSPCGGHFALWSNIKCPHCNYEFPYNRGVKSPAVRISDPTVVVVDGATVLGDGPDDSWIARVEIPQTIHP